MAEDTAKESQKKPENEKQKQDANASSATNESGEGVEVTEASSGKMKLLIMIIVPVLLLAGGAGYFLLGGEEEKKVPEAVETVKAQDGAEKKSNKIQYYPFAEDFTVNLSSDDGRNHFMRISITLMTRDEALLANFKEIEPLLRNDLLTLFSSQTYENLKTIKGKQDLRVKAQQTVRAAIQPPEQAEALGGVLFTNFVME